MATKKSNNTQPAINILPQIPSEKDKEALVGGKKYEVAKRILIPVYLKHMEPVTTTLVECNDGWFQVYDGAIKKHFRIGPVLVAQISGSIKEIK